MSDIEAEAHRMAREFIRGRVERGDSISDIVASSSGRYSPAGWVDVGGSRCSIHQKLHRGRIVHVTRVGHVECCHVFMIEALNREIREPEQLALFVSLTQLMRTDDVAWRSGASIPATLASLQAHSSLEP
jgi:hypothetical protein